MTTKPIAAQSSPTAPAIPGDQSGSADAPTFPGAVANPVRTQI